MKRSVTVNVAGQRLVLRSDVDEATVQELADEVGQRMRTVQAHGRAVDTQQVALLVALQLAEELQRERAATAELKRRVRDKSRALLAQLAREAGV
jgi:cell division protein ZapA